MNNIVINIYSDKEKHQLRKIFDENNELFKDVIIDSVTNETSLNNMNFLINKENAYQTLTLLYSYYSRYNFKVFHEVLCTVLSKIYGINDIKIELVTDYMDEAFNFKRKKSKQYLICGTKASDKNTENRDRNEYSTKSFYSISPETFGEIYTPGNYIHVSQISNNIYWCWEMYDGDRIKCFFNPVTKNKTRYYKKIECLCKNVYIGYGKDDIVDYIYLNDDFTDFDVIRILKTDFDYHKLNIKCIGDINEVIPVTSLSKKEYLYVLK